MARREQICSRWALESGDAPELWNETHPQNITKLYQMAVDAGSDLFLTNSFGGNASRLKLHNAGHRARELSRISAELGRKVADKAGRPVVVAGSVGPTGDIMQPVGSLSHADAVEIFHEQAEGLKKAAQTCYGWKPFLRQKNIWPPPKHFQKLICHGWAR